ncbi:hypothetical protein BC628DRAFT_1368977 [Trametes gibbosa]|nr:hypothetical protein BC628DRAFT_1368977 [Trametes gibbosa]
MHMGMRSYKCPPRSDRALSVAMVFVLVRNPLTSDRGFRRLLLLLNVTKTITVLVADNQTRRSGQLHLVGLPNMPGRLYRLRSTFVTQHRFYASCPQNVRYDCFRDALYLPRITCATKQEQMPQYCKMNQESGGESAEFDCPQLYLQRWPIGEDPEGGGGSLGGWMSGWRPLMVISIGTNNNDIGPQ